MDKDLAQFIIQKASSLGAQYSEARLTSWESSGLVLKNRALEANSVDKGEGVCARVLVDGNMGFLATNRMERSHITRLVEEAVRNAKRGAARLGANVKLSAEKMGVGTFGQKPKRDPRTTPFEDKIEYLKDIDAATQEGKANVPARFLSYEDAWVDKHYENSEGAKIESHLPLIEFHYSITLLEGQESMQHYRYYAASQGFEAMEGWKLQEEMHHQVKTMQQTIRQGVSAPKGPIDVVLSPELVGIAVHESCGHPHEADRILGREAAQAGESWLNPSSIGTKVGSRHVTIVDDPAIEGSAGYYLYDDEGVKAKPKTLIDKGLVSGFSHNRETAAQLGTTSNASARASGFDKEPLIRMSNTYLKPGEHKSKEELFEGIKLGIYMNTFMEWNIDDKRLNQRYVGNEAYLIENGRVTKPVKRPALEISTTALWSSIDALTDKVEHYAGPCGKGEPMQGIPVWMGGPYARLRNLTLSV